MERRSYGSCNTVLNVLPYSNNILIAEMKGQTILDALELGCMNLPTGSAGFPQVSGMEYTVDPGIESTVETTEKGDFIKVSGARRVSDVLIDGEPLDPEAVYTVASTEFFLNGGDHYTMFEDAAEITGTTNLTDNALLARYIEKDLQGVIPETYMQPGGRIHIK